MAEADDDGPVIGIDLGTTFSCVAVFKNGKPKVISNEHGNRITPSCVSFTDNGYLVGEDARYRLSRNPTRTVYEMKRLVGRTFDEEVVQEDIVRWPFDVVDQDGKPMIKVLSGELKLYSPEEISAMVLVKMKEIVEKFLERSVTRAVITVPAYFNDSQRQATKTAAQLAGLECLRIINEPTAAAIAYGFKAKNTEEKRILMYDLGGGTFDVSIILVDDGILQVLATGGDTHLGGTDFDSQMVDKMVNYFNKKRDLQEQVTTNVRRIERHRLARAVEFAKCQISLDDTSHIQIDEFYEGMDFIYTMHRDEFEEANQHMFCQTIDHVKKALSDASLTQDDIDEVILVGGSTRIPLVQKLLKEFFNDKTLNKSINPDEAVACGAAIEAAILGGVEDVEDLLLVDVTPLTLGVELKGGIMSNIIMRNTLIPGYANKEFTTSYDNQEQADVLVYQGERPLSRDNHYLGQFLLEGIEPAAAGVPKIDIEFSIDADGIILVKARDRKTGAEKSMKIDHNKSRLSQDDLERLLEEAGRHQREDSREKELILARNKLETCVQWLRYILRELLNKLHITANYRDDILSKCKEIDDWLKDNKIHGTSKDEYNWQYDIIMNVCKDLPPEYLIPGQLPDGSRIKGYMEPTSLLAALNEDQTYSDDDEEVGDID